MSKNLLLEYENYGDDEIMEQTKRKAPKRQKMGTVREDRKRTDPTAMSFYRKGKSSCKAAKKGLSREDELKKLQRELCRR